MELGLLTRAQGTARALQTLSSIRDRCASIIKAITSVPVIAAARLVDQLRQPVGFEASLSPRRG